MKTVDLRHRTMLTTDSRFLLQCIAISLVFSCNGHTSVRIPLTPSTMETQYVSRVKCGQFSDTSLLFISVHSRHDHLTLYTGPITSPIWEIK